MINFFLIPLLSSAGSPSAKKHYTQQDRNDALRQALQLKLDSLS